MFLAANSGVVPLPPSTQQYLAPGVAITVDGVPFSVNPTVAGAFQVGSTMLSVGQTITRGSGASATLISIQTASGGAFQVIVQEPSTTLTQAIATTSELPSSSTGTGSSKDVMSSITVDPTHATSPGAASPTESKKSNAQKLASAGAPVAGSTILWCLSALFRLV
ncbi:hypothetical protein K461DRAFT_123179 [Myriangium duriaei CBS 260.36]|uniref:Uncharacterized protein n=1 Tax=Myriangium duriaei CBS 260.36 TaxID=1168546 RepID=A0A9P4J2W5_9PEZI|nr:hypothetical protein K461DRAFT_123179 [Myriangium duriaei CBS 260.36]